MPKINKVDLIGGRLYPKPLGECSRKRDGKEYSEHDMATAINRLPMEFTEEELDDALHIAYTDNLVCEMMIRGLVEPLWDEKLGEITFTASDKIKKKKKRGKAS